MCILYFPPFIFTVNSIRWHLKILLEGGDMRLKISLLKGTKAYPFNTYKPYCDLPYCSIIKVFFYFVI